VLDDIKSFTRDKLGIRFKAWEQPVYRVAQLLEWLHVHRVASQGLPWERPDEETREKAHPCRHLVVQRNGRWHLANNGQHELELLKY
jgi:hypothetical protein